MICLGWLLLVAPEVAAAVPVADGQAVGQGSTSQTPSRPENQALHAASRAAARVAAGARHAAAKPDRRSVDALVYDLVKLVAFFEQRGWTIDRYEVQRILPEALLSICRCSPAVRAGAARELTRRIEADGGPSRRRWQRNGHDLDAVSQALRLERAGRLLAEGRRVAAAECAYWMQPGDRFRGHQIDTDHITLNAEGGGLFSLRRPRGTWRVGGGGSGRLTVSLPLSSRWKLRIGPEIGGAALIGQNISAEDVTFDSVWSLPITFRRFAGLYLYDIEVAPMELGMWWRERARFGLRVGGLFGLSAPRLRTFLPWTGLAMAVEWVPAQAGRAAQWTVRMGFRVGFAWRLGD